MPNLYHLLFSLLTLLPLTTTNTATHYVAGKAVSKGQKTLQTRLKATAHRKDYVAKLAKSKKTKPSTNRPKAHPNINSQTNT